MDELMQEAGSLTSEPPILRYGSYRVLRPLGVGGMSSVYRAIHEETGHEVALKVLPLSLAKNPIVLQRFIREAHSAELLEHPHIVSIYDRGIDQGRHYLVLEYVKGNDLHEYVQLNGPMSAREAIRVVRGVAEGLKYAAERGLVHRDIKPSNILRAESTGEIKITDLGLARQPGLEDERVTREGTTVGTVDYMSPEQARDSRAANSQSDQYSLGCTFYYLLTGVPPYPGGDVLDKLTRHVKFAPPDVRDLRPDLPLELSRVIMKMMAKQPEARYASFDELASALDEVSGQIDGDGPGVALQPIDDEAGRTTSPGPIPRVSLDSVSRPASSVPEISLTNLPHDLIDDHEENLFHPAAHQLPGTRGGGPATMPAADFDRRISLQDEISARSWIAACVGLGLGFLVLVIVIDLLVRPSPPTATIAPDADANNWIASLPAAPDQAPANLTPGPAKPKPSSKAATSPSPAAATPLPWVEPEDAPSPSPPESYYTEEVLATYLPSWALAPVAAKANAPIVQVRRISAGRDAATVPSLRMALDDTKATIEISDNGPFTINDFRVPGENRTIRAREGFRPAIRIDRPAIDPVRGQPGVIVLDGKSLVLESLDLIVNVRDLSASQGSLFVCNGANLTLRDCTITVVNPSGQPFSLVKARGSSSKGSRVFLEHTMVRGQFVAGVELGPGAVDVVFWNSMLVGCQGAIVRCHDLDRSSEHRFSSLGSVLGGQGPAIDLIVSQMSGGRKPRPVVVRSFDSIFGRFQGAGIASVINTGVSGISPRDAVDWLGDANLFCGWKGFFSSGPDHLLRVETLAALRSTWNNSDLASRQVHAAWPKMWNLDRLAPETLAPFVPSKELLLARPARPRPSLEPLTVRAFPAPNVPRPRVFTEPWSVATGSEGDPVVDARILQRGPDLKVGTINSALEEELKNQGRADGELIFNANEPRWQGDLGAYLRETITEAAKPIKLRVIGSGVRRFTPVRLPDGLSLTIRVDPPNTADSEWLSWMPRAESGGATLIELHGGSLVLSRFRLRNDESTSFRSLIAVNQGHLVLHACQLTSTDRHEKDAGWLIDYRAASTQPLPRPGPNSPSIFTAETDRPACVIGDSVLISADAAIRAEVGRGIVAVERSAIAARTDAITLVPSRVARDRFDADLMLDRCTIASETNIIRLERWPGAGSGPDRPWLVTSHNNAFLGAYERRVSETVLLRADEGAMARGSLFWQGSGDAAEVEAFTATIGEPPSNRSKDLILGWVNFWGGGHIQDATGTRAGSSTPSIRLFERLKPGRVEARDLTLDPSYHPGRRALDVGADIAEVGPISPPRSPNGQNH